MSDAAYDALRTDPDIGPVVEREGQVSLEPVDDLFERLVVSILRQQVSMASAAAIRERLFETVEVTPSGILEADSATLRSVGLSGQKTRYVKNVAETFQAEEYTRESLGEHSNEEIRDRLTAITGVGEWTANMQLMFAFGREDVFPVGDLGIRNAMWEYVDPDLSKGAMVDHAERWRPYRSYAALYLWRGVED